jgi:hypothetical protein
MTKEAMTLALEALENNRQTHHYCEDPWYSCPKDEDGCANDSMGHECNCGADKANAEIDKAITSLRQAIAEAEKQKPYGWAYESHGRFTCNAHPIFWKTRKAETHTEDFWEEIPLYRSPQPKREPLTFEQVEDCFPEGAIFAEQDGWLRVSAQTLHDIARNIEAAHGIKENT